MTRNLVVAGNFNLTNVDELFDILVNIGQHPKEGNEFAQAVNKAKAAGMKAGDKFKVGDKEYTLKDAIELAGLQLEEFFQEEEPVKEQVNEDKKEDSGFNIAGVDEEVDRIVNLANYQ